MTHRLNAALSLALLVACAPRVDAPAARIYVDGADAERALDRGPARAVELKVNDRRVRVYPRGKALVLVMHGFGGSIEQAALAYRLHDSTATVAYLEGTPTPVVEDGAGGIPGARCWNALGVGSRPWEVGCLGYCAAQRIDDVGHVGAVLAALEQRFGTDPARRFLVGHSNGGYLALTFAVTRPGDVAGVAVVGADLAFLPSRPVPPNIPRALLIRGERDSDAPIAGGTRWTAFGSYEDIGLEQTAAWWGPRLEVVRHPGGHEWVSTATAKVIAWAGIER